MGLSLKIVKPVLNDEQSNWDEWDKHSLNKENPFSLDWSGTEFAETVRNFVDGSRTQGGHVIWMVNWNELVTKRLQITMVTKTRAKLKHFYRTWWWGQ